MIGVLAPIIPHIRKTSTQAERPSHKVDESGRRCAKGVPHLSGGRSAGASGGAPPLHPCPPSSRPPWRFGGPGCWLPPGRHIPRHLAARAPSPCSPPLAPAGATPLQRGDWASTYEEVSAAWACALSVSESAMAHAHTRSIRTSWCMPPLHCPFFLST